MGNRQDKERQGSQKKKLQQQQESLDDGKYAKAIGSDTQPVEDQSSDGSHVNHGNLVTEPSTSPVAKMDLFSLVSCGDHKQVENLLQESEKDVNIEDENGYTPLMLAALHDDLSTMAVLLKYHANVRARSSKTCTTALQEAILNDKQDDVINLLQQEEDRAFHCITQLFTPNEPPPPVLVHGVTVDERRADGHTPLMLHAAEDTSADVVVKLLELGADVNLQNKKGYTALMCAVEGGHLQSVKELLERDSSVNIESYDHKRALDFAKDKAIEEVLRKAMQKPVITFENLLADYLSKPRPTRPADALTPAPPPTTRDRNIPLELKEKWQAIAQLETEVHELTLQATADDLVEGDTKDDSSFSFMEVPRLEEEYKKLEELKDKTKALAIEAKVTSQRLSAENVQLKEDLSSAKLRNEAERKVLLKELERVQQEAAVVERRTEAKRQAVELERRASGMGPLVVSPTGPPKECVLSMKAVSMMDYTVELSLLHVAITGLPLSGKSQILSHLIPSAVTKDCIIRDDGLSVREAVLISDGHTWNWMQVSKSEGSALGVGVGISQAYARESHTPSFEVKSDEAACMIWESVKRLGTRFADTKGLTLVNVWDIGGSRVLFDLLPLLLPRSKSLVLLSVLSLASDGGDLHSPVDMNLEKYRTRGDQDMLVEPYSKLDYLMVPPSIAQCDTIVVGTHGNQLPHGKLRAKQRSVQKVLRGKAEEMGLGDVLYPKCIAVNATNKGDVIKMRNVLDELISKRHMECKKLIPITWLCFRDFLNNHSTWYITKEELLTAAKDYGVTDELEVESFLAMYYDCGSIVYCPSDTASILHEHVIIKPCVFLDMVKRLCNQHRSREHHLGYLTVRKPCNEDDQFVLKVLEEVDLLIKVDDSSASEVEYFMPSLCPKYTSPALCKGSSSLYATFSCATLPCHYLARFMKIIKGLYSTCEVTYKLSDYSNQLHLQWADGEKPADVDILIVANYLEVKVKGQADDPSTLEACSVFKSATIDFAQYISQRFPNIQYQLSVVCPSKPHFIPFHALEEVGVNCKEMFCPHCKEDVDLGDNTLVWLRAAYKGPRTAALKAEDVLTDDLIVRLSHDLAPLKSHQIEQLGIALGYTTAEIKEEISQHQTMQEFVFSMLQTWKNGSSLPIRESLSQALVNCGYSTQITNLHVISEHVKLSSEELLEVSHHVSNSTHIKSIKTRLHIDDPEVDCYKVLEKWSAEEDGGDRGRLVAALFDCGYVRVAEFLQMRTMREVYK